MPISKELIAATNTLHEQAMDYAEEGDSLVRQAKRDADPALYEKAHVAFWEAYRLEFKAAELIPTDGPTTESEPTRSVLYQGAMNLAFSAQMFGAARTLAEFILTFTQYQEIRHEAEAMLVVTQPYSVVSSLTTESKSPNPQTPTDGQN